jgi:hypothetical protein
MATFRAAGPLTDQYQLDGRSFVVARQKNEAARARLAEGIERSRRLVDRYRALLVRLHDPSAGAPILRRRPAHAAARIRPAGGSS